MEKLAKYNLPESELVAMSFVRKAFIEQYGEVEGQKKIEEYENNVIENLEKTNQPKQQQPKQPKNICSTCGGKLAPAAVEYCKDNGIKPTCYKCQEKKNMNRYVNGKQQDEREPSAH